MAKKIIIQSNQPITTGLQLALIAADNRMLSVFDRKYGRIVLFCDQTCADAETTKAGNIRRYTKRASTQKKESSL